MPAYSEELITDQAINIQPISGDSLVVTTKHKYFKEDLRPFTIIGELKSKTSYSKETKLDPLDRFARLSKTGQRVFLMIKDNRDRATNIATVDFFEDLSSTDLRYVQRGLKDLLVKKIICKAKPFEKKTFIPPPHTYMIDPLFIKCNSFTEAKEFWAEFTKPLNIKKEKTS